jgi:hypothetical protein
LSSTVDGEELSFLEGWNQQLWRSEWAVRFSPPSEDHQMSDESAWWSQCGLVATYQLSFCVSGAIARSTFSFSARNVSLLFRSSKRYISALRSADAHSPRSLMLKTPLTVLLVLRCLILLSVGEAGVSSMAESTLLRGWVTISAADMVDEVSWVVCWVSLVGVRLVKLMVAGERSLGD